LAECCVFDKQSVDPVLEVACATPLLPKLRGYFAEFLNEISPNASVRLYQFTCVGFGTVERLPIENFLVTATSTSCLAAWPFGEGAFAASCAERNQISTVASLGKGILTLCPSVTCSARTLGPTNPRGMTLVWETLNFRRPDFSSG